jgi:hypothetical protein
MITAARESKMTAEAKIFIDSQDTKFSRTQREKAKYLVGKLLAGETPHIRVWTEVTGLAVGLTA